LADRAIAGAAAGCAGSKVDRGARLAWCLPYKGGNFASNLLPYWSFLIECPGPCPNHPAFSSVSALPWTSPSPPTLARRPPRDALLGRCRSRRRRFQRCIGKFCPDGAPHPEARRQRITIVFRKTNPGGLPQGIWVPLDVRSFETPPQGTLEGRSRPRRSPASLSTTTPCHPRIGIMRPLGDAAAPDRTRRAGRAAATRHRGSRSGRRLRVLGWSTARHSTPS
jgi:hypothetical protein